MQTDEVAFVVFLCSDLHTVCVKSSSAVIMLAKILGSLNRNVPKLRKLTLVDQLIKILITRAN